MDWPTVYAVLVGSAITLISTLAIEIFRDWRQRRKDEVEEIRRLQADILELWLRITAVLNEKHWPKTWQVFLIFRTIGKLEEFATTWSRIVLASTSLANAEARRIADTLRREELPSFQGEMEVFAKEADVFVAKLRDAADQLGKIIRKRAG